MGSWLTRFTCSSATSVRLFCFHCAGGSASEFRSWAEHLSVTIELVAVQLPGREGRISDPFILQMDDLVADVVDAMRSCVEKPYVIFGHSFGAILGFEVIRELRRRGLPQPSLFIPAGRRGPQVQGRKPPISSLSDDLFVEALRRDYGDHINYVLDNPELREFFLPQIRADYKVSEAYRFASERPLDCPILAFAGDSEDTLNAVELNAWSEQTRARFRSMRFPGDHFFIRPSLSQVVEAIKREIVSAVPPGSRGNSPGLSMNGRSLGGASASTAASRLKREGS